jgi:HEAT repeat protein
VVADQLRDESPQEVVEEKVVEHQEVIEEKIAEPQTPVGVEQASEDVAGLLAGQSYDEASIGTGNPEARQMVAAELLAALAGRNVVRQGRAREAFVKHGYFDDATRTLRTAESPAERASAARSLGLVRDESGTPHLVAALEDPAPEVRRAAVESLAEVRDPAAVAPLEALRDREKNRKVPTALIQHAIEASVIGRMKMETPTAPVSSYATTPLTADAESNPVVSEPLSQSSLPPSIETTPLSFETLEPLPPIEVVVDTPEENRESPLDFGAEPELVQREETGLKYGELDLDATSDIEITHVNDESILDTADLNTAEASKSEWVDVDVTQESTPVSSEALASDSTDAVDEILWDEPITEAPVTEITAEADELVLETASDTIEPSTLPFDTTEDVAAESIPVVDERGLDLASPSGKEIEVIEEAHTGVSAAILRRLASEDDSERAAAVDELGRIGDEDSFREVSAAFDDPSPNVRNSAARALFNLNPDRAASFTRALREGSPERRRNIGSALSSSGLASDAIGNLMGESREKTYDAFSLLFLMAKAGEVQPLMRAVEEHPNSEVRLAVVKLLALSGQQEILPAFRRLAVRGSLPTEVRSAVMEAIYQISSQSTGAAS